MNHFKFRNQTLISCLERDIVLSHPIVVAELACGIPPEPRRQTLDAITQLKQAQQISLSEVMSFVEREKLYGLGCGLVDIVLLGSTLLTDNTALWTLDKKLLALAERFSIKFHYDQ